MFSEWGEDAAMLMVVDACSSGPGRNIWASSGLTHFFLYLTPGGTDVPPVTVPLLLQKTMRVAATWTFRH